MDFDAYQDHARSTAFYPQVGNNITYPALGLTGEAGEVADKIKKILRDEEGFVSDARKYDIALELGDVLWYVAQLSAELGFSMGEVADMNIEKLKSRHERNALHGSGDRR